MFVSPPPTIMHADLDAFYASVEQRDDPALRGRPVIVGGGVVLAASYEAKRRGVRTAMGGRQARKICPDAVVVAPRFTAYAEASRAVFGIFAGVTPHIEAISIDEAFLDVSGLRRIESDLVDVGRRLRASVREQVGLPITVGMASTKHLAKVASQVGKPDGILVVPSGGELAFLEPLPIERLWGVGKVTSLKLRSRGVTTIGELDRFDQRALSALLGPAGGRQLHALSHNDDVRVVHAGRRRSSIGSQRALGRRNPDPMELDAMLAGLVDRVARRLRADERTCRTVVLRLRFADFARATRAHTLPGPTDNTAIVLTALRRLLQEARPLIHERGITLIGVTLANLDADEHLQLELPFGRPEQSAIDRALDDIRTKYGVDSIGRGALLRDRTGPDVPILPD
ncbi:MAG: DNA polymerase IV [Actinobacteria bacterium]|nr:DNA polymerase IV [Actinomycetota bacterium]